MYNQPSSVHEPLSLSLSVSPKGSHNCKSSHRCLIRFEEGITSPKGREHRQKQTISLEETSLIPTPQAIGVAGRNGVSKASYSVLRLRNPCHAQEVVGWKGEDLLRLTLASIRSSLEKEPLCGLFVPFSHERVRIGYDVIVSLATSRRTT